MHPKLKSAIVNSIEAATGASFKIGHLDTCDGGCINHAVILSNGNRSYFVKLNDACKLDMFEAEAAGLQAIANTKTIQAPRPITQGSACGSAFLVLEALDFGTGNTDAWFQMGQQLAAMHRHTSNHFGWHRDNTIGSTRQINTKAKHWDAFFRDQRLGYQLKLARQNGYLFKGTEALISTIPQLLEGHKPDASLLHGDLWSGNVGFTTCGNPAIYDPASYYGDRETDLAFSEYFGGFPAAFYQGYHTTWPLPPDYPKRKRLYNLYHVLNHANLFGGGYANEAQGMINQLLASQS